MSPNDKAGRIDRRELVLSTSVLLAFCVLALVVRFYVRIQVQKQVSVDDAFLIVAFLCLVTALAIFHSVTIDKMYLAEALLLQMPDAEFPVDFLPRVMDFHKWITVVLMLTWCAIMAVKFSFLFLFRKLIDRVNYLIKYWWVITIFNVGVLGYGVSVYYVACPYYYSLKSLECSTAAGNKRTFGHALAQMLLDLIGDVLIQVKLAQKFALGMSLCLTVFMIIVTIVRVSGIHYKGIIDNVWEVYWLLISAEIGIFMAAATAFRKFYSSRSSSRSGGSSSGKLTWYTKSTRRFKDSVTPRKWRTRQSSAGYQPYEEENGVPIKDLPSDIPRAYLTGARTFIEAQGRTYDDGGRREA